MEKVVLLSLREVPCARNFKLSKSRKSNCCYRTANAVVIMLAVWERPGQGKMVATMG
jgi:hypothetical protein